MRPDTLLSRIVVAALITLGVSACSDDEATSPTDTPVAPTNDPEGVEPPTSPNPRIKFKGPKRLQLELARVLGFEESEVCTELGEFDCFLVHNVALGGADPFGVALYSPSDTSTATTPLAVERVVLAGCIERAVRDLSQSPAQPVIFKGVTVQQGRLDPEQAAVSEAIDRLYTRSLQRHAAEHELARLRSFYTELEGSGESSAPAQDWAALSCFTVLTSLESLFY